MKKSNIILPLFAFLYTSQQLLASVSILFEFQELRNSAGVPLDTQTLTILIADSDKNSVFPSALDLLGATLNLGDDIAGNRVFFTGTTGGDGATNATLSAGVIGIEGSDLGLSSNSEIGGTRWAVYWFPGLSTAPVIGGIQEGQSFGFYHSDQIDSFASDLDADVSMVMPADGTQASTAIYVDNQTYDSSFPSVQDFTADLTVVPEPSLLAMLAFIGLTISIQRRRRGG